MRSVILVLASLLAVGCGLPEVEAPGGGQAITSDKPEAEAGVTKPVLKDVPQKYPNRTFVLRGTAPDAARVFVKGAGNPVVTAVQPTSDDFCIVLDLANSPAEYTLQIQSQATNGELSEVVEVKVVRQPDAPPPPSDTTLCDGTPLN